MGRLLEHLGLGVSKNVQNAIAARAAAKGPPPDRHAAATAASASAVKGTAKGTSANGDDDAMRKAALALKADIEHRLKATREEWKKLSEAEPKVAKLVAAATGKQKADLEDKKKRLDKKIAEKQDEMDKLAADAEVLDNPGSGNEEYAAIVRRHKSDAHVDKTTEIDLHDTDLSKKRFDKHETTTTTSYQDGTAYVDKKEHTRTVGLGGVTTTDKREVEVGTDKGSVKAEEEKKTSVSTTGKYTREHKKSIEVEHADGTKTKVETSSELEVSKEGVSGSKTKTISNRDGSSTADKTDGGLERGEGKLGGAYGKTKTTTDASGMETTKSAKGKGGLVAGEDGLGAYGEGKGSVGTARPGGFNTKASLGLTSNIVCDIGEPGDDGLYPLTLKVRLGASIDAEVGQAKKGGSTKIGIGVKASKEVTMEATEHLTEAELASYVKALQAASKGGKIASTKRELKVIQAGASKGWEIAKQMYESGGGPKTGEREGDTTTTGGSSKKGASGSVSFKAVSAEGSYEASEAHSTKATRNKKGGLDVESSTEKGSELSGKGGVDTGVTGMSNKRAHTEKTSIGYTITIEAGKDPDGKLLASFRACTTPEAQDKWIAANKGKVTVTGKKTGSLVGDKQDVGMKVLGADIALNYENSVEKNKKTDEKGDLVESDVTGKAKVGGSIGVGDFRIGDSVADETKSKRDGKGNVEMDLTRTKSSTSFKKLLKKLPFMGDDDKDKDKEEKKKGKSGLLTDAAGGGKEKETDDRSIAGIHVTKADLARVVAIARSDPRRWTACVLRMDDYHPWEQVMRDVASAGDPATAGDLLAEFAGKSPSTSRRDILEKLIRPTGDLTMATRSEFPESLRKLAKPYKELVMEECEARVDEVAKTKGKEEAGKLGKEMFDQLESMLRAVLNAEDFAKPAVQAEMSSAIQHRKTALQAAMRRNAGGGSKDDDAKAMRQEFGRLRMECGVYQQKQNELIGKFDKLLRGRQLLSVNVDGEEGRGYIEELGNLFALWRRDYAEAMKIAKANGYTDVLPLPKDDELKRLKRAALMSSR